VYGNKVYSTEFKVTSLAVYIKGKAIPVLNKLPCHEDIFIT